MKLLSYINYGGNCRQAFEFYAANLDGRIDAMMTHAEAPPGSGVSEDWKDAVLHARLELGGTTVYGADIPNAEPMRSAYLTLILDSVAEAERVYELLTDGGQVFMPMAESFFAKRFAMLRDRFGTSWMLLHSPVQS